MFLKMASTHPEELAASLRGYRENLGLPRRVVARAVGVSEKTVQHWEAGTWKPSEAARRKLEVALSLEPGRLSPTQLKGHALESFSARGVLLVQDCERQIEGCRRHLESCLEVLEHCAEYLRHVDAPTIRGRAQVREFREGRVAVAPWKPGDEPCSPEVEAGIEQLVESHVIPERDMSERLEEAAQWGRVPEQEQVSDEEWDEVVTEAEKQWTT